MPTTRAIEEPADEAVTSPSGLARPRVLVVDDSRAMRLTLSRMLSDLGMDVVEAADGVQALDELARASFEIVFIDWYMPNLDGLSLVQRIRGADRWKGIQLVMVTSECEDQNIASALEAGVDEYVTKPFDRRVFEAKLAMIGYPVRSQP